jgi:1-deoxyxylulose-5-phosphate synthase
VVEAVDSVAKARGVPSAQVALAWLLHKPGVSAPIVGSTKEQHLRDALAAEELTLGDDEVEALEKPYVAHPVLGHF